MNPVDRVLAIRRAALARGDLNLVMEAERQLLSWGIDLPDDDELFAPTPVEQAIPAPLESAVVKRGPGRPRKNF
jgi:hypothetical protein